MQGQQRKIQELQQQLQAMAARLEESERGRRAAEQRVQELSAELENNASVFKLHYEGEAKGA
jgi:predicted RNase H-like nuclease (RuvC/YqgF family)